jgi:LPS-assembly protein
MAVRLEHRAPVGQVVPAELQDPQRHLASNYLLLESTSQAFLRGQGDRSFFDLRGFYFQGLSYADWQKQIPFVAPVLDYDKRVNGPEPIGGEARFQFNFTSLYRQAAQFDPTSFTNLSFPFGSGLTTAAYQSCVVFQRGVCLVRGLAGDFARVSGEVSWRRAFIDDAGQSGRHSPICGRTASSTAPT